MTRTVRAPAAPALVATLTLALTADTFQAQQHHALQHPSVLPAR